MANHSGYIRYFDLVLYDDGFVLMLPEAENPQVIPPFVPQDKIFRVQKESREWSDKLDISCVGDLNDRITKEGIRSILLVQEALHEAKISGIAEQIKERGGIKFIMIAGPSSSGKTTFSHRLSIQLMAHGMRPHPIAVDNYFVNRDQTPLDEFGEKNYECLEALMWRSLTGICWLSWEGKRWSFPSLISRREIENTEGISSDWEKTTSW